MPPAVSTKQFLQALWGATQGWAELAVINTKGILISALPIRYPDYLDTLLSEAQRFNQQNNVYMGVCLKREKWPRKTGRKDIDGEDEVEKRGTEVNALSSVAVWLDIDFKGSHHESKGRTIDKEVARKMLAEFPLKPSIIVKSGGDQDSGIHPYWLLKEPAIGAELRTVKAINKALALYFKGPEAGADTKCTDLARILRLPGSTNWNLTKPEMAYVSWWRPELTYALADFEQYLDIPKSDEFTLLPGGLSIEGPPTLNAHSQTQAHQNRSTPTAILDDEACQIVGKLFSQIWFKGTRHDMSLCIAGWMAFAGVKYECALKIVQIASTLAGGQGTDQKLHNVKDTYTKFVQGAEVTGRPSLEALIDSEFPAEGKMKQIAKQTLEAIQKILPKPRGFRKSAAEIDFKILNLVKYTSQPAVWTVTLEKDGQKLVTKTEHTRFMKYEILVEDVFDQNGIGPAAGLKNPEWRHMINLAIQNGLYEEKPAPEESRPAGAIEKGLEEFLAEAKESPDIGLLKKFPGYDDTTTFFRLETLRDFLDEQGRKVSQNQLTEHLKAREWESKVRRFGKKLIRVWMKDNELPGQNGNGNGHSNGNGHHHPTPQDVVPVDQAPPPSSDLFKPRDRGGDE